MREAQGQDQLAALLCAAVANALDLQVLAEAFGNTDDHVVDEGAGQAMQTTCLLLVDGRVTRISLPSTLTVIWGWNLECRVPFGPLTVMA